MECCLKWTSINNCDRKPERMGIVDACAGQMVRATLAACPPFDPTIKRHQIPNTACKTHGTREVVIDRLR
jgi:hypothetical protein